MYTLGLNATFHDSSAALVQDGVVVAAAEEERFSHIKHAKRPIPFSAYDLPYNAIDYCLKEAGIDLVDVDHIAYAFDPFLIPGAESAQLTVPFQGDAPKAASLPSWESAWEPLFSTYIQHASRFLVDNVPHHLQARFRGARADGPYRWHYVEHHTAHAASAFLVSPYTNAAVLTLDGRGELATTSHSLGAGNTLQRLAQINMPHSLGLLYEEVTDYLGFLRASDEYKVMALASFGKPVFANAFRDMIHLDGQGGYTIDPYALEKRFGPRRLRGGEMPQHYLDVAHSLQVVLEETVLELATWLHRQTNAKNLCMAGGVALNCVMNSRVRDKGPFENVWVQPAAGDAGTALGAAIWVDSQQRQAVDRRYIMDHAFLGPSYDDEEIEAFLTWSGLPHRRFENKAEEVAELLSNDKVIGWYEGRMEFGPRALGGRSILASPIHASMQARLNEIKDREDFRPVAPVVLEEEAAHWFQNATVSPFMLFVFDVRPEKADQIPAARHVDGTARVQTINRQQNPSYYDVLKAFYRRTGVPVLVNTSFNTRGEPVVCSPRDAVESFWTSPLDALVIGSYLLEKKAQDHGHLRRRAHIQTARSAQPVFG